MYRRKKIQKFKPVFPDTVEGFGYIINDKSELRHAETGESYDFKVTEDHQFNEARHGAIMDVVGEQIEATLQANPLGFIKTILPLNADPNKDKHTYIYMTSNALTTTEKLLVLIPGKDSRIGQWHRRVICDESVDCGSMIEVSRIMRERGYEIIILNPNGIYWWGNKAREVPPLDLKFDTVPENESPEGHCEYVFRHLVRKSMAKQVAVIAAGWGTCNFVDLLNTEVNFDFLQSRCQAVVMAEATHAEGQITDVKKRNWFREHAIVWLLGDKPKGEALDDHRFGCPCVSAGKDTEFSEFVLPHCLPEMLHFIGVQMGEVAIAENKGDEERVTHGDDDIPLTEEEEADLANNVISLG